MRPTGFEDEPEDEREVEKAHLAFSVVITLIFLTAVAIALVTLIEVVIPLAKWLFDSASIG